MQKKIIALAVAGLVSGAAFAQSNVQIFGIMDAGYQYSFDSKTSNTKDQSAVIGGGLDGSRVGFRGTEDLGNGLKANFEFTEGFDSDTGASYGGRLMSEGAWVGLSGNSWGEVRGGYFGTLMDDNTGIDVTGRKGIANTGKLYDTGKWANQIAYYSPSFAGFQAKVAYSSNIGNGAQGTDAQDKTPSKDAADRNIAGYGLSGTYANGGLKLGAAYASYQPAGVEQSTVSDTRASRSGFEWNAGVSYDFKVVAVSLFASHNKNAISGTQAGTPNWGISSWTATNAAGSTNGDMTQIDKRDFWSLGIAVPITARDSIKLGYGEAQTYTLGDTKFANGNTKDKATDIGLLYTHDLSKRTKIYAMYGNVDSDNGIYSIGGYQQAVNVGIDHLF